MPRVSVICAAYNHARYVAEAIESVLAQTHRDTELILVDDGSDDDTATIARGYEPRITVVSQPNKGVVAARNRALELASGQYISLLDSDDAFLPDKLVRLLEPLERNAAVGVVYSDADIIDEAGRSLGRFFECFPPKKGDAAEALFRHYCFVPAVSVLFRRSAMEACGPFRGPGATCEYMKWIEMGLTHDIVRVEAVTARWRQHAANESAAQGDAAGHMATLSALEELLARHPAAARLRRHWPYRRARECFVAGLKELALRRYPAARGYFRRTAGGTRWAPCGAAGWLAAWGPWRRAAADVVGRAVSRAYHYRQNQRTGGN